MKLHHLLVLGLANLLIAGAAFAADGQVRVVGVVPQGTPSSLARQWEPLIRQLQTETGIPLRFATAPSITRFEQRVLNGDYDFVYMNSLLYVRTQKSHKYEALVHRQKPLRGILVVKKDSIKKLSDLNGATIAFPAPTAFGATLLPRAELDRRGIKYHVNYAGSHASGYQSVIVGVADAAGGVLRTFSLLPEKSRNQLRILLQTRPVTGHVVAANSRVPKSEIQKMTLALINLRQSNAGRKVLDDLKIVRFVPAKPADFRALKKMSFQATRRINSIKLLAIPRLNEKDTRNQLNPMISYIRQHLELDIKLETYPTMSAFDQAIATEKGPALINANPSQAIKLSKHGYRIIAQQTPLHSPEGMRGLILVSKDSPYRSLADLKGKRIAFGGNRNAFFANTLPRIMLARAGLSGKYEDASIPGPVSEVVRRLYAGEIDAAGTGLMAFNSQLLKKKYHVDEMRILAQSKPLPGLAWLVSGNIPNDLAREIQDELVYFGPQSPGHKVMNSTGIAAFKPASIKDYKPIEQYLKEAAKLR